MTNPTTTPNRNDRRDALDQPLPVMAAANEQFKKAKALGLGESDFSAVYESSLSSRGAN
jgi:3-hydroxyisobutyrate dehydrogenase-like beta-hydroxyacid dehydrogenase